MLLFFFTAMWCSPFRGCWDALFILGPLNLCAVSRCWGIDRAQWWTGSVSHAANQKVNSLSIEEGKWPPGLQPAHLSCAQQLKCNCFWLCPHAYRTPAFCVSLLFMSLSILILTFNAFLYSQIIFLGELLQPSLTLETEIRSNFIRGKGSCPQQCVFALFFRLHLSAHLLMCIFQLNA